jgi:hypothetical protein
MDEDRFNYLSSHEEFEKRDEGDSNQEDMWISQHPICAAIIRSSRLHHDGNAAVYTANGAPFAEILPNGVPATSA